MLVVLPFALIILLLLVVLFVLYRLIYSYQINKALQTGKQVRTITPATMILAVVIAILLFMNIFQFKYIQEVWSDLGRTRNEITALNNEMTSKLSELSKQLTNQTLNTYDVSLEYNGIQEEKVVFDLDFKIKSVETGSTITILVEDGDGEIEEYTVINNSIVYSTSILLPFDGSYKLYLKSVSQASTYIELFKEINPQEVLVARFEVYDFDIQYHNDYMKIDIYNAIATLKNKLQGLEVDYIRVHYFAYDNDESSSMDETIIVSDFIIEKGEEYSTDYNYLQTLIKLEHNLKQDYDVTVSLTIIDKDGNYYYFSPTAEYTSKDLTK